MNLNYRNDSKLSKFEMSGSEFETYGIGRDESLMAGVKNWGVISDHLHIITWIKVYFRGNATVLLTSLAIGLKYYCYSCFKREFSHYFVHIPTVFKSQGAAIRRMYPIVSVKIQNKLFGQPGFNECCFCTRNF